MAKKTVILRPFNLGDGAATAQLTTSDGGVLNCAYINEEIADDDATYIEYQKAALVTTQIVFLFDATDMEKAQSIKLVARLYYLKANSIFYTQFVNDYSDDLGTTMPTSLTAMGNISSQQTGIWETISMEINLLDAKNHIMVMNDNNGRNLLAIGTYASNSSSSTKNGGTGEIRLSQIYLEVVYDEPSLCVKTGGVWNKIDATIYKNNKGLWTTVNINELPINDNVIIKVV